MPESARLAIRSRLEQHKAMAPIHVKNFMDLPVDIKFMIVKHVSSAYPPPQLSETRLK